MNSANPTAASYFPAMHSALGGLESLLSANSSPFSHHSVIAGAIVRHICMDTCTPWQRGSAGHQGDHLQGDSGCEATQEGGVAVSPWE